MNPDAPIFTNFRGYSNHCSDRSGIICTNLHTDSSGQCSGSVSFWDSRIRIRKSRVTDPDTDPDSNPDSDLDPPIIKKKVRGMDRILLSSSKNNKKTLDFYCFVTSYDFWSVKSDVNVYTKRAPRKHREKKFVGILNSLTKRTRSGSGSPSQRYGSEDPDPYKNVTAPEHYFRQQAQKFRKKLHFNWFVTCYLWRLM